jgi:hypothetical protein
LFDLTEEDKKLKGFDWKIYLRPLSKYDIFERATAKEREEMMKSESDDKPDIMEQ